MRWVHPIKQKYVCNVIYRCCGAIYREFESMVLAAEEMLDHVICSREQFSFQMWLESGDGSGTLRNWIHSDPTRKVWVLGFFEEVTRRRRKTTTTTTTTTTRQVAICDHLVIIKRKKSTIPEHVYTQQTRDCWQAIGHPLVADLELYILLVPTATKLYTMSQKTQTRPSCLICTSSQQRSKVHHKPQGQPDLQRYLSIYPSKRSRLRRRRCRDTTRAPPRLTMSVKSVIK